MTRTWHPFPFNEFDEFMKSYDGQSSLLGNYAHDVECFCRNNGRIPSGPELHKIEEDYKKSLVTLASARPSPDLKCMFDSIKNTISQSGTKLRNRYLKG